MATHMQFVLECMMKELIELMTYKILDIDKAK